MQTIGGTVAECLVIQHIEPEGPAVLGDILTAAGIRVRTCRVFAGDRVPDSAADVAALVVMGGPMSAHQDEGFPTRQAEISLLQDAVGRRKPVLGICLGAQLLAAAAGGRVYPGQVGAEIGWGDVTWSAQANTDPLLSDLPERLRVLHWHGDTFDPPPASHVLASSPAYPHQAFRVGTNAWGLQFHLEVDLAAVRGFVAAFGSQAREAGVDPAEIPALTGPALESLSPVRDRILGRFADLVLQAGHGKVKTIPGDA